MATKAELEQSTSQYQEHLQRAVAAEFAQDFGRALAECELAWQYVSDMMQYRRKFEDATFKSVPCIDLALRLAPLLLRTQTIDAIENLLKSQRSIDKHATDDLAQRLAQARQTLNDTYRVWDLIERNPGILQSSLRERLGGDQNAWRGLAERWEAMGIVERLPESNSYKLWISSKMSAQTRAKCPQCGSVILGPKRAFLQAQICPSCARSVVHVVLEVVCRAV